MRIQFDGKGEPIPPEAMPTGAGITLPPITLNLPDGSGFDKDSYLEQGYNRYEIWCIGAAGGQGGGVQGGEAAPFTTVSFGGGGGGGGLQYVEGELAGIPDDAVAKVGQAGDNAPTLTPDVPGTDLRKHIWQDGEEGTTAILNPDFTPPEDGEDGGYSSFGTEEVVVSKASGGKGGKATPLDFGLATEDNRDPSRVPGGDGGEGGQGGSDVAGSGGSGGHATPEWVGLDPVFDPHIVGSTVTTGGDGSWDGAIGEGGGGGAGGTYSPQLPSDETGERPNLTHLASNGGAGNFAYGDTSVYGPKATRQIDATSQKAIIPGGGGGGKVGLLKYGSHAPGYSPNGAVVIRLTKVV